VFNKLSPTRIPELIKNGKSKRGEYVRLVWEESKDGKFRCQVLVPQKLSLSKPVQHRLKRQLKNVVCEIKNQPPLECLIIALPQAYNTSFTYLFKEITKLIEGVWKE
jgi:ribonuclease P protein component